MAHKHPDDDSASMPEENCPVDVSVLTDVGDMIGKDWKALGLKLGLTETMMEHIELDERGYGVKRMAFKSLETWKRIEGDDATLAKLIDRLIAVKRKDIVDKISPKSLRSKNIRSSGRLTGPWTTSYALSLVELRSELRDYKQQGYRLTNLVGYEDNGSERYLTLWVKDTSVEWEAMQAMSKEEYITAVKDFKLKGYQVTKVCGYVVNNATKFAAIWEKQEESVIVTNVNMTYVMFKDDRQKYDDMGYHIVHLNAYTVNKQAQYAAIWEQCSSVEPLRTARNCSLEIFKNFCKEKIDEGFRINAAFGYCMQGTDHYGGLFDKRTKSRALVVNCGCSYEEYLHELDKIIALKFTPTYLHAFASGSSVKYCILYNKE